MKTYKIPDISLFGIKTLDDQHQELFAILQGFHALDGRGNGQAIEALFDQLLDLLLRHFADEEQLMIDTGYPCIDEHGRHHRNLLADVGAIRQRVADRGHVMEADINQSLDKILRHMLISDGPFNLHLKEIGYRDSSPGGRDMPRPSIAAGQGSAATPGPSGPPSTGLQRGTAAKKAGRGDPALESIHRVIDRPAYTERSVVCIPYCRLY